MRGSVLLLEQKNHRIISIRTGGSYEGVAVYFAACLSWKLDSIFVVLPSSTSEGSFAAGSLGSERFDVLRMMDRILLVCSRSEHDASYGCMVCDVGELSVDVVERKLRQCLPLVSVFGASVYAD